MNPKGGPTHTLFKIGHPGGPGRPKMKRIRDEICRQLDADPLALHEIVENLIQAARGKHSNRFNEIVNSIQAAEYIRDTIEGKPAQTLDLGFGGDNGNTTLTYEMVIDGKPNKPELGRPQLTVGSGDKSAGN